MTTPQYNFSVNLDDLAFILKQIKIAEASTNPITGAIEGLPELVGSPLLPYGLRTVDGSWNSLLPGQERLGAADDIMPRLVPINLQDAEPDTAGMFGPPSSRPTSYTQTSGIVIDSGPRTVSNLIVDQTASNPAAVLAALARAEELGQDLTTSENGTLFIPNMSPDVGLSPAFNGWMTFFGQFFDHGLDLVTKGNNGTVFIPLKPDDPLYVEGSQTNFMVLTRATQVAGPGADGILADNPDTPVDEAADNTAHESINTTTPFIDQNQTYTSHPSHQVFLREYQMVDGKPMATGHLLSGAHGPANWGEVKAQAADMLGIKLTDMDVHNVPLLATDRYGEFLRGEHGFVQIVTRTGLVEGDPAANGGAGVNIPPNALYTDHAFLNDIAHGAVPGFYDHDHNPATAPVLLQADEDTLIGAANPLYDPSKPVGPDNLLLAPQPAGTYDNELLDRHFITGDGRGNENIGLTAVHTVFHSEHNRLVDAYKETILASGDLAFINEWLATDITQIPTASTEIAALNWDGERLFQAGRFATEMQYQHLVFEEFARGVQPAIDPFVFSASADLNPAIVAEFAHVVYRFGHSMLNETVARIGSDMAQDDVGLIQAFLNPLEFDHDGNLTTEEAIGSIVRGMSRQTGNEIDEFVTEALRNNLVGLPLDLAATNMARARETGMPSFNEARTQFYAMTGDSQLEPYSSWADFAPHLKNPASIINFIAAYGTHDTITAATTLESKRAAATLLVMGNFDLNGDGTKETAPSDRVDFLNHSGAWANRETGLNDVDFWIGGLAEAKNEFGGMLGATFNFVFEAQMESLQNGDRFYYLSRTQGLNMLNELEGNSFSALVMRNSDLGDAGSSHLPGDLFGTANYILEVDQSKQIGADPVGDNAVLNAINPLVIRLAPGLDVDSDGQADGGYIKYNGADHVVLGGTAGNDTLIGGIGIDTLWGDGGNDRLDGGDEADKVHGGDGDDIITDHGTPVGDADFLFGDAGNDVIFSGMGNDIIFGGSGQDYIALGADFQEVFAGRDDDFILGGTGPDTLMGNEGNDWIEGGEGFDGLAGDNSQLFFNSTIIGHDVLNGQGNDTDYDGESGDDIMVQGPGIQRSNGMLGFDWGIHKGDPNAANSDLGIPVFNAQDVFTLRDRFDAVEALSGWKFDDTLTGTNFPTGAVGNPGGILNGPDSDSKLLQKNVSLIDGFQELLGVPALANPEGVVIDPTNGADILIGGGGSDTFNGKAGDDLIDGDAWLNVRISIRDKVNPNIEIRTIESLNEIKTEMLDGTINPGQLRIVREILMEPSDGNVDTAVYSDLRANYQVTRNPDGTYAVAHVGGTATDGTDKLRNIERLQFADTVMELNKSATGKLAIDISKPVEGVALTASLGTVADGDGMGSAALAYQWQILRGTTFLDIEGATGASFTPTQAQVGAQLRVVATFTDAAGTREMVGSSPTAIVAGDLIGSAAAETLTGDAGDNRIFGMGGNDQLIGLGGDDLLDGGTGADIMTGGLGNDTYVVDNAGDVVNEVAGAGTDRVNTTLANYALGANVEELVFTGRGNFSGTGNGLANALIAGAGNDTLVGSGGNDTLTGGAGTDTASYSGALSDYVLSSSAGVITVRDINAGNGNEGTDILTGIEKLQFADGTISGLRYIASNPDLIGLLGTDAEAGLRHYIQQGMAEGRHTDTFDPAGYLAVGSNADVKAALGGDADLATAHYIEWGYQEGRAVVPDGNDVLAGTAATDTLNGYNGNDTLTGGGGNDTLIGGAGSDTAVYAGASANFVLGYSDGFITVQDLRTAAGSEGTDKLTGIEKLQFADGTISGLRYIASNPDLIGLLGTDAEAGLRHYIQQGMAEGRHTDTFDPAGYLAVGSNADVKAALGGDADLATAHYIEWGYQEGRAVVPDGNDVLAGTAATDTLNGYNGNDTLTGGGGNDTLIGGAGSDTAVYAGASANFVLGYSDGFITVQDLRTAAGSEGTDKLTGIEKLQFADGTISGLRYIASNPDLIGLLGTDAEAGLRHYIQQGMAEGRHTDTFDPAGYLAVGSNADVKAALGGDADLATAHYIEWGYQEGRATNLNGNDVLTGTASSDTLNGQDGNDFLIGGAGADIFVFSTSLSETSNVDIITDFVSGSDILSLDDAIFTALIAGAPVTENFVAEAGASAHEANDFFLYDTLSGNVYYDADGSGSEAAVQFASLIGQPALTANDFLIS